MSEKKYEYFTAPELGFDEDAVKQLENACDLPISVRGALMPDCHRGYGLPIGGVLATENAVIPYAVGVDISCSVKMTLLDIPVSKFESKAPRFRSAIQKETRFGAGGQFGKKEMRQHAVMDEDWSVSPITLESKDRAWRQLGTSGSGNHFVEIGIATIRDNNQEITPGEYIAILSHSGSRGTGALVCEHYKNLARENCPDLSEELKHLSWLSLDSQEGQEYWNAMNLMHDYAMANHELIHKHIAENLGLESIFTCQNSHNLAWKEVHGGRELIVHRKGATPADKGLLGLIAGSMMTPSYIVEGLGNEASLKSCSHGAGRVMSRKQAKEAFLWSQWKPQLEAAGIDLLSAGLDEMPGAYKDIEKVIKAQTELIVPVGTFQPKIVKMADGGRAED